MSQTGPGRVALILIAVSGFIGLSVSFAIGASDDFFTAAAVLIGSCAAIIYAGARLLDGDGK